MRARSLWLGSCLMIGMAGCGSEADDGGQVMLPAPPPTDVPSMVDQPMPGPVDAPDMTGVAGGAAPTVTEPGTDGAVDDQVDEPSEAPCSEPSLELEGMMYSPGGTVLPRGCEPFHPTTNNPYAVRCIDAWPWYATDFPGDEFCILPPEPGKGIQYGVHPQGKQWYEQASAGDMSGYDGLATEWTMEMGEEETRNYHTGIDGDGFNYYRSYTRMRGGSHHMIVSAASPSGQQEIWEGSSPDFLATSLPGAQRPDENVPKSLDKPAEDAGLYGRMPSPSEITFNMHHFNATDGPILKEAWTNMWFEEDATIEIRPIFGLNFGQTSGLAVQPGETVDLHYSWDIRSSMRLVMLFGHRHAWTTSFSAWLDKPDGEQEILYQSFDWFDEPTYRYDSITQNPVPNHETLIDGASSGLKMLNPGETLHFNCHIEYTEERAASEGAPSPTQNGTLRFANEAFTAEMCILFGSTTGGSLLSPSASSSPLPDFARE